jgi:hypothetical protein
VSLLGNHYGCGLGYMMSTPSTGFAGYAYSLVDQTCAAGNLSLAHEMGHNMGLNHDPANASGTPSYTYAYGFQQPSGLFRTVMAYPCPAGSCPRLMYFSNPGVAFNGHATGTSTQNNALALNNTVSAVANFRQSVSGSCTYTLTPTSSSVGAGGATSSFTVTSQAGCASTASSSQSWLTITSGASGSGTRTVGYSVAANTAGTSRSATITAGGKTFTVTQAAAACSYSISSTSQSAGSGGGSFSVNVTGTTGCAWTAVSNSSWITVSTGASGSGNGSVSLSVASNASTSSRTGTVTIAGKTYTVTEAGATCSYSLSAASASPSAAGGTGGFTVTTTTGCAWTAASSQSWLTITSGASGTGTGSVGYSVAANTAGTSRSATITAGGHTFTVTQAAATCFAPPAASPTSAAAPDHSHCHDGLRVDCDEQCLLDRGDPGTSGSGNGTAQAASPPALDERTGTVTIAGQTFTVTQAGIPCSFVLTPGSASPTSAGGASSFAMAAPTGCSWTATSNQSWLSVTSGGSGSGDGSIGYSVAANTAGTSRSAITAGSKSFTVTQPAASCSFSISSTGHPLPRAAAPSACPSPRRRRAPGRRSATPPGSP